MGRATVVFDACKSAQAVEMIRAEWDFPMGPGATGVMLDLVWNPEGGQAWALHEGYLLPHWEMGATPHHFETFDALLDYVDETFHDRMRFARGNPAA